MSRRASRFAGMIGVVLLASACASHAPAVECDKRLAPINVGETPTASPPPKGTPSAGKPKS